MAADGQITDSPLVSSEQIAAGGMNSVRGYLSAEATGDYGVVGSLELRAPPLPFFPTVVEDWRVYAFVDGGQLRLREPLPEQDKHASRWPRWAWAPASALGSRSRPPGPGLSAQGRPAHGDASTHA